MFSSTNNLQAPLSMTMDTKMETNTPAPPRSILQSNQVIPVLCLPINSLHKIFLNLVNSKATNKALSQTWPYTFSCDEFFDLEYQNTSYTEDKYTHAHASQPYKCAMKPIYNIQPDTHHTYMYLSSHVTLHGTSVQTVLEIPYHTSHTSIPVCDDACVVIILLWKWRYSHIPCTKLSWAGVH